MPNWPISSFSGGCGRNGCPRARRWALPWTCCTLATIPLDKNSTATMAPNSPQRAASKVENNSRWRVAYAAAVRSASNVSSRVSMVLMCSRNSSRMYLLLIRMVVIDSDFASLSLSICSRPSILLLISGVMAVSCARTRSSRTLLSSRRRADWIRGLAFR
ncbi:hypothetical protein D9M71_656090 [compost metagenome]